MPIRIKITMEGMLENSGHVNLPDFIAQLNAIGGALRKMDIIAGGDGESSSKFRVVNLSHSSPATVVLEQTPLAKRKDTSVRVESIFKKYYGSILAEKVEPTMDLGIIENFKSAAKPIGKKISSVSVYIGETEFNITRDFARKLDDFFESGEECYGSICGRLESINIHDSANIFTIYPETGPKRISCKFSEELLEEAADALNRKVEVFGVLKYPRDMDFPNEIYVQSMEKFLPDNELTDLWDMKGVAPDCTNGLSSEDFIRRLRDEWV